MPARALQEGWRWLALTRRGGGACVHGARWCGAQVDIQVAEAGGAEMARLYLAGFGLPLRRAGKKDGARS